MRLIVHTVTDHLIELEDTVSEPMQLMWQSNTLNLILPGVTGLREKKSYNFFYHDISYLEWISEE